MAGGAGARLYKTGDLARWRHDGELELLGRRDHQVKVRGFRIELGEVESVLARHPAVRQAVVAALDEPGGGSRLAAFLVPAPRPGRPEPEPPELERWLAAELPVYMVPRTFVTLEELPLTPSGKVDRRALARLAPASVGARSGLVEPRTVAEEMVAAVWADVLGVARLGVEDGFFDLGGHSLLATRVMARLREAFGVELPVRTLFESPTVAGLAAAVERARAAGADRVTPPIRPAPRHGEMPVSFSQARQWILVRLDPDTPGYNMPVELRLEGDLAPAAMAAAATEVVRRHEALRTAFAEVGGVPVQRVAPAAAVPVPLVDLAALPTGRRAVERERRRAVNARRVFDLERGPLLRLELVRIAAAEHLLLVVFHHIVADGWSLGVFAGELGAIYRGAVEGRPSPLPELDVQYPDYAMWQRSWLAGDTLEAQVEWWRRRLGGAPPALTLPTDRPRPPMLTHRGGAVRFALPAEIGLGVRGLGRRLGATPFMTLLAAFAALLARHAGADDLVVGTYTANRRWAEIERLIGFFVNTLALRVDLGDRPAGEELVRRVRDATLGAYENQDVPFETLLDRLEVRRDLGRSPVFQVLLAFQNFAVPALELPGLRIAPVTADDAPVVHYDLTLWIADTGDGFAATLHYNADLFDRTTALRLCGQLGRLIEGLVEDPGRPVAELPVLGAAERHQLLREWNAEAPAAVGEAVVETIARRAAAAFHFYCI